MRKGWGNREQEEKRKGNLKRSQSLGGELGGKSLQISFFGLLHFCFCLV